MYGILTNKLFNSARSCVVSIGLLGYNVSCRPERNRQLKPIHLLTPSVVESLSRTPVAAFRRLGESRSPFLARRALVLVPDLPGPFLVGSLVSSPSILQLESPYLVLRLPCMYVCSAISDIISRTSVTGTKYATIHHPLGPAEMPLQLL